MAIAGNTACNSYKTALMTGAVNFATDNFYLALYTNSADLSEATTAYTATGEVSAPGYTPGGLKLTVNQTPAVDSNGTAYVSFADVTFNAAITARGGLVYKQGGTAVCVLDFGADKTSTTTFKVQFPAPTATTAILRID